MNAVIVTIMLMKKSNVNNKKQNKNEESQLNETYRLILSASISCIISVPNISTKSSTCEVSVLHSSSIESYLIFFLPSIV